MSVEHWAETKNTQRPSNVVYCSRYFVQFLSRTSIYIISDGQNYDSTSTRRPARCDSTVVRRRITVERRRVVVLTVVQRRQRFAVFRSDQIVV